MSDRIEPLFTGPVRPGPASIPPGSHPGGVVIHVYAVPSGVLITQSRLRLDEDIEFTAEQDAALYDTFMADAACLVAYDGDTGERFAAEAWHTADLCDTRLLRAGGYGTRYTPAAARACPSP